VSIIFHRWFDKCKNRHHKSHDTIIFQPHLTASNIHYKFSDKTQAFSGDIGLFHTLAQRLGRTRTINERLHQFKFHMAYSESDHVLNIA
jgi:hypothetical protein